jgi:hypothetical protein
MRLRSRLPVPKCFINIAYLITLTHIQESLSLPQFKEFYVTEQQ